MECYNNGSFEIPDFYRMTGIQMYIPDELYKEPFESRDFIYVKRKVVLGRREVIEVGKINYTVSVFGLHSIE